MSPVVVASLASPTFGYGNLPFGHHQPGRELADHELGALVGAEGIVGITEAYSDA